MSWTLKPREVQTPALPLKPRIRDLSDFQELINIYRLTPTEAANVLKLDVDELIEGCRERAMRLSHNLAWSELKDWERRGEYFSGK